MARQQIRFGVIGCGLMGQEFASAAARWCHLLNLDFEPQIVAVCDARAEAMEWFRRNVPSVRLATTEYRALLESPDVDAVYVAVPHNLHAQIYGDTIRAGKALLGEKPFGIDLPANRAILDTIAEHPGAFVRCSSQFPFFPGSYRIAQWMREGRFGQIIDVEAGFWHSSDLNPLKPINWKRRIATNGEYGCMGDLGMHVLHLPLRFGWQIRSVRALLSKIVTQRPDQSGQMVPCETWDNGIMACEVETEDHIGLLHALSQTLSALRLDISAAKICTERGAAIDSFYVTEIGGGRVQEPERLKHIERKLRQAIDGLSRG